MRFRSLWLSFLVFALMPFVELGAMTDVRRSLRVFVTGPSESGKNRILEHLFTSRTPRVLSLDVTGEVAERDPNAIRTFGLEDLRDALKKCVNYRSWRIAAHLDDGEYAPVFAMLMPRITSEESTSYPRAIGGMAIECGEMSIVAPNGRTAPEIKRAPNSGRHYLLSLYLATQAPASVDRSLTAQAEILIAFGHREDVELDYWRRATSSAIAGVISELPRYHSVFYNRASGRVMVLDQSYRPYRVLDLKGNNVPSSGPRLVRQG